MRKEGAEFGESAKSATEQARRKEKTTVRFVAASSRESLDLPAGNLKAVGRRAHREPGERSAHDNRQPPPERNHHQLMIPCPLEHTARRRRG